ncbi:hypothetical protein RHAB21_02531 [Pseudorhizobium halotolerans]|uniref:Terminase small subunit n=1 Tax=Pseudorhizobium halotolerans TaxID=1233081 RepID=A0ABM8PLI4_9HYPH|nr:hypothetical protein [Pseudorhizobium halotolerans]CAD7036491.1 hypothetical protein RHAB21_02531 [Pseudorhizobium halotolerans]
MEAAVTKGEFAAIIGVSPGRVSQYLTEGKISPGALLGAGRNAKIIVERAKQDLRMSLDIGQRLGNGIDTRLDPVSGPDAQDDAGPVPTATSAPPPLQQSGIDYEIKQQKLEQIRRANRNAAIADAQSSGRLMETDHGRAEMTRIASSMMLIFEGGLTDFASAVASEFKVQQRDVLHLLRREFRKVREKAAKQAQAEAVDMPLSVASSLEADDIETIN